MSPEAVPEVVVVKVKIDEFAILVGIKDARSSAVPTTVPTSSPVKSIVGFWLVITDYNAVPPSTSTLISSWFTLPSVDVTPL